MNERHRTYNVPARFAETRSAVRARLSEGRQGETGANPRPKGLPRLVRRLVGPDASDAVVNCVLGQLSEVEVTYVTLLLTLDQSVPIGPIHEELKSLHRKVKAFVRNTSDERRDEIASVTMGMHDTSLDTLLTDFRNASTLAQRVTILSRAMQALEADLAELSTFFDYKRGMTSRGRPSEYATIFAVSALIDIFEENGFEQRKAWYPVQQSERGVQVDRSLRQIEFQNFLEDFLHAVNPGELFDDGYQPKSKALRNLTYQVQIAKLDVPLHTMLEGEPGTETVLAFMSEADRVRSSPSSDQTDMHVDPPATTRDLFGRV